MKVNANDTNAIQRLTLDVLDVVDRSRQDSLRDKDKSRFDLVGGTENANGVTADDAGDTDIGPNNLINKPNITSAIYDGTNLTVSGNFQGSAAGGTYLIEFFANGGTAIDPSGFGEGAKFIEPVIEYPHNPNNLPKAQFPDHGNGLSVTGGYVYRGAKYPSLRGVYIYADYNLGTIWGLRYENEKLTADDVLVPGAARRTIPSFGEDSDGELYVLSFDGTIYEFTEPGK